MKCLDELEDYNLETYDPQPSGLNWEKFYKFDGSWHTP